MNLSIPGQRLNATSPSQPMPGMTEVSIETVQDWLAEQIASQLGIAADTVEVNTPFHHYGLNSVQAMAIAAAGKQQFGLEISPLVIWNCPTIDTLSAHIVQEMGGEETELLEI